MKYIYYISSLAESLVDRKADYKSNFVFILFLQLSLCILAAYFTIMLYADGAYFSFIIAEGQPWESHWQNYLVRTSALITTVIPTYAASILLKFSGAYLVGFYAFLFNFIILLQFSILYFIMRKNRNYMILPILGYIFGPVLGYGFPSEAMLAPGFFWICVTTATRERFLPWIFYPSYALLLFTHELSLFLFIAAFFSFIFLMKEVKVFFYLFSVSILTIWLILKISGASPGGSDNLIYLLDPRRFINNPSLWIICISIFLWAFVPKTFAYMPASFSILMIATLSMVYFDINFLNGRYESARITAVSANLTFFAVFFFAKFNIKQRAIINASDRKRYAIQKDASFLLKLCSIGAVFCSIAFLYQWNTIRVELVKSVVRGQHLPELTVTSLQSLETTNPALYDALNRWGTGTSWTWPFAAIMIAPDYQPAQVVMDQRSAYWFCEQYSKFKPRHDSPIKISVLEQIKDYSCKQEKPKDNQGRFRRILEYIF